MKQFLGKNFLLLIFIALLTAFSLWISRMSPAPPQTNLVDLAYAFLHGRPDLIEPIRVWNDYAIFNNKYYIYFGPLAGILYIPFVLLFGLNFPQQSLIPSVVIITLVALYKMCRNLGVNSSNSLWLVIFFMFGSIYFILAITTISSYNVQLIALLFLVLALLEFTGKKRPFIIGTLLGLGGLTRPTLYLALIFFILEFLKNKQWKPKERWTKISQLLIIPIVTLILFGTYNYVRFSNPLDTGYGYLPETYPPLIKTREYGIFSPLHIPGNLYILFFKAPDPVHLDNTSFILKFPYLRANELGMGIFFTSPVLIYLILAKLKEKYVTSSFLVIPILLIVPLSFYGAGIWQYGYRYALDIYPFLIIILASIFKDKMPFFAKTLIIYGIVFSLLFSYSIWNIYPFKF